MGAAASQNRGQFTETALSAQAEALSPELLQVLGTLERFDEQQLYTHTPQPLGLLAYLASRDAASALGPAALKQLPRLLASLATAAKEQRLDQHYRLHTLQFLYHQTQINGALAQLKQASPIDVVALVVTALAFDLDLSKVDRQPARQQLGGTSTTVDPWPNTLNRTVPRYLCGTHFYSTLSAEHRAQFLKSVCELIDACGPPVFNSLLSADDRTWRRLGSENKVAFLAKTTLMVALHSHLFRKFKEHQGWCERRVAELDKTAYYTDIGKKFIFKVGDHTSARFVKAQHWFIEQVLMPFLTKWASLVDTPSSYTLSAAASRVAKAYAMTYKIPDVPPFQLYSYAVQCRRKASSPIGDDADGILSVCLLYNTSLATPDIYSSNLGLESTLRVLRQEPAVAA